MSNGDRMVMINQQAVNDLRTICHAIVTDVIAAVIFVVQRKRD